jgi:hypothetical protein
MSDIKKELIDFETHCFETGQLQVGELISSTLTRIAELEQEKKILYIEGQIEGVELVADWIDGYYAPCVVGVVDELAKELKKLRGGV